MTDRPIRASDKERDSVVDVLRDAYTDGRLTLEEFEERTSAAYASKTWTDLRELTSDLPVEPVLGADLPQRPPPAQPVAQVVPTLPRSRHGGRNQPLPAFDADVDLRRRPAAAPSACSAVCAVWPDSAASTPRRP